ncbi:MAG: hypothetical protein HRT45_04085 [Bdellovibrionales bacterium]|nr:hypothetical protein [Bdellovibrionales bacterium]
MTRAAFLLVTLVFTAPSAAIMLSGSVVASAQDDCKVYWQSSKEQVSCSVDLANGNLPLKVTIDLQTLDLLSPPICLANPSFFFNQSIEPHLSDFNTKMQSFVFPKLNKDTFTPLVFNFICHIQQ